MNIIITGASGGIGKSIVKKIDNKANNLCLLGYKNIQTKKKNNKYFYRVNFDDCDKVLSVVDDFIKKVGTIHCVILCAGTAGKLKKFEEFDIEDISRLITINSLSNILIIKRIWRMFKKNKFGRIVSISSNTLKFLGSEKNFAYYSSKALLESQSKYLAKIGAKYNINVNIIRPGVVNTNMFKNVKNYSKKDYLNRIRKIPRKKQVEVSEISELVEYLISDKSNSISGNIFTVSGGE